MRRALESLEVRAKHSTRTRVPVALLTVALALAQTLDLYILSHSHCDCREERSECDTSVREDSER